MNVKILEVKTENVVGATIRLGDQKEMPSMHDGWRFNFNKHCKLPNANTYVLVSEQTPNVVEGCLVFEMKDKIIPNIAYLEIAPHNQGNVRKYDYVAGCLIAFAFKQSLIKGKGDYRGILALTVAESSKVRRKKLLEIYCEKYNAVVVDKTVANPTLLIMDEAGEKLISKYLNRK